MEIIKGNEFIFDKIKIFIDNINDLKIKVYDENDKLISTSSTTNIFDLDELEHVAKHNN